MTWYQDKRVDGKHRQAKVWAGSLNSRVERTCQSAGGREKEQDKQRICRKAQERK